MQAILNIFVAYIDGSTTSLAHRCFPLNFVKFQNGSFSNRTAITITIGANLRQQEFFRSARKNKITKLVTEIFQKKL